MPKKIINSIAWVILASLLFACNQSRQQSALEREMSVIKQTTVNHTKSPPPIKLTNIQPEKYTQSALRDPFENVSKVNVMASGKNPLLFYPLNLLRFIGVIVKPNYTIGIIITPDNQTYEVKVGDHLGNHYGKIMSINHEQMEVLETFSDEAHRLLNKTVILQLKG